MAMKLIRISIISTFIVLVHRANADSTANANTTISTGDCNIVDFTPEPLPIYQRIWNSIKMKVGWTKQIVHEAPLAPQSLIGQSDFWSLLQSGLPMVDKSLFIVDYLINCPHQTVLVSRPRRHGKSICVSMLYYFLTFSPPVPNMFKSFAIDKVAATKEHQNNHPVIFISFAKLNCNTLQSCEARFSGVIALTYQQHAELLQSNKLSPADKKKFERIMHYPVPSYIMDTAIKFLMMCMQKHYGKAVIVLVDEVDRPLLCESDEYPEILNYFRQILEETFKDNQYLKRGLMTGLTNVVLETMFSGLNNIRTNTIKDAQFSIYFGFTEEEVKGLLKKYNRNVDQMLPRIKENYDGYWIGGRNMYNPYSVMSCIAEERFENFWANSETFDLPYLLRGFGSRPLIKARDTLVGRNESISVVFKSSFDLERVKSEEDSFWSFLAMLGYLTFDHKEGGNQTQKLRIPNREVLQAFKGRLEDQKFKKRYLETKYLEDFIYEFKARREDRASEMLYNQLKIDRKIFSSSAGRDMEIVEEMMTYSELELGKVVKSEWINGARVHVMTQPNDGTTNLVVINIENEEGGKKDVSLKAAYLDGIFKALGSVNVAATGGIGIIVSVAILKHHLDINFFSENLKALFPALLHMRGIKGDDS